MFIRVLTILTLLLCAVPAYAADPIGTVMAVEGTATLKREGAEKAEEIAVAMPVHMNDTIETGAASRLIVLFVDETKLLLGENVLTSVDEYVFDPAATSGNRMRLSVLRGAFQYVSGLIGKHERPDVRIDIPYGAIGLRGTTVWGGDLDQYGVLVLDGKVSVQTKRGSVILNKGEGVDLANPNAAPAGRKIWGQPKVDRAVATITLKEQDAANKRIDAELTRLRTEREKIAPALNDGKEGPKPPVNPEITPEKAKEEPVKKSSNPFGDDEETLAKESADALDKRKEKLQHPTIPAAPAPTPPPAP